MTNEVTKVRVWLVGIFMVLILSGVSFWLMSGKSAESESVDEDLFLPEPELVTTGLVQSWDMSSARRGAIPALNRLAQPRSGMMAEWPSGKVLWAKDHERAVPVASMSKMMTILLAFEEMKRRPEELKLDTRFSPSREAVAIKVGAMGLSLKETYSLREVMMAAVIRSANDAAYMVGDIVGGNGENFVKMMNQRCEELGMTESRFINPHGLPEKQYDNLCSAQDMLQVAAQLMEYPQYFEWSTTLQTFICDGKKELTNTNNLFRRRKTPGVDGLKTGYTRRAGFCLAFSCQRDGRRIIGVVTGFPTSKAREDYVEALLDWGFTQL